jgi:phage-related protein
LPVIPPGKILLRKGCPIGLLLLPLSSVDKKRGLFFFKDYFNKFYSDQTTKVQKKILWTLKVIEDLDRIPEIYFKHLEGTDGLYEIRIQSGSDIFRILCFFDDNNLVVIGHGFRKKTQKTPEREIERGEKIKREYYEEKKLNKSK